MTEALTADLAQIGALRVIARASVMQYKGTKQPLAQIAQRLNVEALVSGSVVRSGQRQKLRRGLSIRAATGQRSFGPELTSGIWVISSISKTRQLGPRLASVVRARVTPREKIRLAHSPPVNAEAYDAYLKGRYYYNRFTADGFSKSIEVLRGVLSGVSTRTTRRLMPGWRMFW